MACEGDKNMYVSTFSLVLKPAAPTVQLRRMENGTLIEQTLADKGKTELDQDKTQTRDEGSVDVKNKYLESQSTDKKEEKKTAVAPKRRACSDKGHGVVKFLDPVDKVQVRLGERAQLYCSFRSLGPTASCWIHDQEKVVVNGERTRIESSSNHNILTISEVLPVDTGRYSLFVRNHRGTFQHTIMLSIRDRPERPASCPFVSQLTPSSLVLSWCGPSYDGGSPVMDYVVEMQNLDQSESGDWNELTSQCKDTTYRVTSGLHPQGEYRFRVRACNAIGVSEPSEESDCISMETAGEPQEEETPPYVDFIIDTTHKVKDHYNIHEKLGVGKFGQVFRLTHKETSRVCAGKFYRAPGSKEKEAARGEIELMKQLHHPKLVQCLGAYISRSEIAMIMEYVAGGELFERIVAENFEHTEPTSVQYMRQILEGVQYMHHKSIIHLDLKPENIVCVNSTGTLIKIIDFGLARKLEPGKPLRVMQGTPEFVAPEVINYEPVALPTDMWSIGVICYILLSGESPFQGSTDAETLALITAASWEFDTEFDDITDEAKDFICKLLKKEKGARMSCEQALSHPWMLSSSLSHRGTKNLNKDKMKRFLARQRWKKTGKAVLALKRMTNLSHRSDGADSPSSSNSPSCPMSDTELGTEACQAVRSLEQQLRSEPSFPQTPHDLTEPCGANVHMACVIEGYPEPEVVWLLNDEPLEETERVQIEYKEDGLCILTLSCIQLEDSGIYECHASNYLGEALCSARLTVHR
ncbi:myosin light chain kinase, smooth muscle-like isoform X1 [Electrophorus electricus]|uniref:myosin light chain kinase, smooth muscle-like isoform X1 n=1 Tax=Electrophorus electricus TaxID=8005 RepID=UPI0015CFFF53|nr:myosin light chain kinase, smooth muscle-like isoform X1 [Electrophorus electricus]